MKRKKNYLLFILGNFLTTNSVHEEVTEVIDTLTILLEGKSLKYIHHDNLILCHFQSYESIEDIDLYLSKEISPSAFAYFLIPKPRKMGLRLEDDLQQHLLNLNINTLGDESNIRKDHISDSFLHISEVLSSFKEDMISEMKKHSPLEDITYNVDDILDKINLTGMDSLTSAERQFLDEQRHN